MNPLYIPPTAQNMRNIKQPPLMVGIQGPPGSGKTWASLTFPNPIVIDVDRSMTAHEGKDIPVIPFWNNDYCINVLKTGLINNYPNKRDALLTFLTKDAVKFTAEQTLILDSWTSVQNCFEMAFIQPYSKDGNPDTWAFWNDKIDYSKKVCLALQNLNCMVVVTFHEYQERNKQTGELIEKIQPLMQGKFIAELKSYFDVFIRQLAINKIDLRGKPVLVEGKPLEKDTEYFWQVKSDTSFDVKIRLQSNKKLIKADYKELINNCNAKA